MGLLDKAMTAASGTFAGAVAPSATTPAILLPEWKNDRKIVLKDPAPESLDELKAAVDVSDPGSITGYWVYAVMALTADFEIGMSMMKYLYADLEPFGRGFTEGGNNGKAGWEQFFNDRLKDDNYRWLPRAYFDGSVADNGFHPPVPMSVSLHYNAPNTEALNSQSFEQLGRLNIVYTIKSNAAGNQVNVELSRFDGSDRWYVTKGTASTGLFYDQRAGLTAVAKAKLYS